MPCFHNPTNHSKAFGPSSSGKTIIIATTEGNVSIQGAEDATIFLVEAKAHISEVISQLSAKSPASKQKIKSSLQQIKDYLNIRSRNEWSSPFYQYANRIAHLYFLRVLNGIPAYLVFVNFLNDKTMGGPKSEEEWHGAIRLIRAYFGIGRSNMGRFIINVFPDVRDLTGSIQRKISI